MMNSQAGVVVHVNFLDFDLMHVANIFAKFIRAGGLAGALRAEKAVVIEMTTFYVDCDFRLFRKPLAAKPIPELMHWISRRDRFLRLRNRLRICNVVPLTGLPIEVRRPVRVHRLSNAPDPAKKSVSRLNRRLRS